MATSEAAIISALATCKLFRLRTRPSGADAGLALVLGEGTGKDKSRRDNLEFVPCQFPPVNGWLENFPTRLNNIILSSKEYLKVPEYVGQASEKESEAQSSNFQDLESLSDSKHLFRPFQFGWMRECIILPPGENGRARGSVVEVIYVSPHSRKLKQRVRLKSLESVLLIISQYFPDMDLKPWNFSFEKDVLGLGWEQEIVKQKVGARYKIQCPICFKLIFNNLNHHMNLHSDIKPTYNELSKSVKSEKANVCPICEPDRCLKVPSTRVSNRHLAMHQYIPTVSRKELSKCYVLCSRVKMDQVLGDGGPRQVCVHCGLRFTYLDGAWKRHVRRCLKLLKQTEKPNIVYAIKSEPLPYDSKCDPDEIPAVLVSSQTCPYCGMQFKMVNLEEHIERFHSTEIVKVKEDPDGPSALARATCASLASEIQRSWTRQNAGTLEKKRVDKGVPYSESNNAKVVFTMRCQDNLVSSTKSRVFSVRIKPKVMMEKGMAAFGRQFGLDQRELEFKCKGKVISADMRASEVGGCTLWVRKL